jgi:aspartyl-tRNA(Asn)/glutamyl-tRNA(Gln) amidotransferase subunit B
MRLKKEYGLDYKFSQILVLEKERVYFFEETLSELRKLLRDPELSLKLLINFFINDFIGFLEKYGLEIKRENITPHEFAHLLYLYSQNKISSKIVKEALELGIKGEMRVEDVIKEKEMISDAEVLDKIIEEVIKEFPQSVEDYMKGEEKALEFLIGQVMKKTKGRAEPNLTRQIILEKISHAN